MKITILVGRFLFSVIFLLSGPTLFSSASAGYAASQGVPLANILVPVSGVLCILGSLSIILGYKARIGAAMIIVFLLPVTLVFHHFWTMADPGARENEMIEFLKNISMLGGAIVILIHGAGPYSLDSKIKNNPPELQPQYANKG
jgi:putative oxidoreductase